MRKTVIVLAAAAFITGVLFIAAVLGGGTESTSLTDGEDGDAGNSAAAAWMETDPEVREIRKQMEEESNVPAPVAADEDDSGEWDRSYHYLTGVREIGGFYIKETGYMKLAELFDGYAKQEGLSGGEYKVTDGKKVSGGVEFGIKEVAGDASVHCVYSSGDDDFTFSGN